MVTGPNVKYLWHDSGLRRSPLRSINPFAVNVLASFGIGTATWGMLQLALHLLS